MSKTEPKDTPLFDLLYEAAGKDALSIQFDHPKNAIRLRRELYRFRKEYNAANPTNLTFNDLRINVSKSGLLTLSHFPKTKEALLTELGGHQLG